MSSWPLLRRTVALLALCLTAIPVAVLGQQAPLRPNEPSPVSGHAQVIAHGVSPMPGQQIGWQVAVTRALLPNRAAPDPQHPGFVLAGHDALAVTDAAGTLFDWLDPGEAAWLPPREPRAVVSLERDPVDYVAISLVPAEELPASTQDRRMTGGSPFAAPSGAAFALDLIRDVLARDEETTITAGSAPSLVLVTDGSVFFTSADGAVSELQAGDVTQSAGDLVVTGASRGAATFVVARIGAEVPAQLPLRQEETQKGAAATPVSIPAEDMGLSLTVLIRACPPAMTSTSLITTDCAPAPPGTSLSLFAGESLVGAATATDDRWSWENLAPQTYELVVNELPAGFLRSSLDDQLCCDAQGGFPVAIAPDAGAVATTLYLFQPAGVEAGEIDTDGDRLTDAREAELGTDPTQVDSDGDALADGDEVDVYGTDPLQPDTDGDGLTDADELLTYSSNPFLSDTDGDGSPDGEEVAAGSNILDAGSLPATPAPVPSPTPEPTPLPTAAASPLPSVTVVLQAGPGPNGLASATPPSDLDGDGLPTADEVMVYGTNPTVVDSDGDGVSDGEEVTAGTNPLDLASHP